MTHERNDRTAQKRSRTIRWGVTIFILVSITAILVARQHISGVYKPAGVDALCPFGGFETLLSLLSGTGFIKHTAASSIVLLAGMFGLALLFRRSFCGQICPLGTLQKIFGTLGDKLFKKRPKVSKKVDRVARYLKYGVLIFFVAWTWASASLVMRPYDPWAAYAHLTSSKLFTSFAVGTAVLALALLGSIVFKRFFCKYLCPMGALLSVFSKLSFFGIKRDAAACVGCKSCDRACPMNITVSAAETVDMAECISCNECVNACPTAGALTIKTPGGQKFSATSITSIIVLTIVAVISISTAADVFDWSASSSNESGQQQSEAGNDTSETSFIKGSMSMREISETTGISEEQFMEKWGVSEADLTKPLKEIKDRYGFSVSDVKTWVAEELEQ